MPAFEISFTEYFLAKGHCTPYAILDNLWEAGLKKYHDDDSASFNREIKSFKVEPYPHETVDFVLRSEFIPENVKLEKLYFHEFYRNKERLFDAMSVDELKAELAAYVHSKRKIDTRLVTLLNVEEAAKFLRVSVPAIRNLVRYKKIPHSKPTGKLVFNKSDLETWVQNSKVPERP